MRNEPPRPYPKTNGSALIVILIILGLAAALLVSALKSNPQIERDKITADALAKAKDALIGYALRGDDGTIPSRPAVFPCPDTHVPTDTVVPTNDPMYGTSDPSCSDGAIGRFPWRTLKTAELLDDSGAPIWYALSGNFRSSYSGNVNSDSKGTLQVRAPDGTTLITPQGSEAAAILFAPGAALAGQARGTAAEKTTASNYLDTVGAISNATGAAITGNCNVLNQGAAAQTNCPTFIAGSKSATFNDRLLLVSPKDFIPIVERRVAKITEAQLTGYYNTCGYYPRPALFSNTACLPGGNTNSCVPDASATQGRFPYYAKTNFASLTMTDWVSLPNWFLANRWDQVIYYAVAPGYVLNAASQTCPGNCLTVDADTSVRRLIVTPGNATNYGNPRPSVALADYLGDTENTDIDNIFVTPTATTLDQLFKHPRTGVVADSSIFSPLNPNSVCTGGCPAGQLSWSVGSANCSATTTVGSNGSTLPLSSTAPNTTGSATAICNVGVWQLSASPAPTCSLPSTGGGGVYTGIVPPTVSQNPGWTGNTGLNSVTLSDGTIITVTSTSGSTPTIYVSNTGIGVASGSGPKSIDLGNGEQMSFTFTGGQQSLAILVGMLKNNDLGYITFKNNGATVGTATFQGCTSSNTSMYSNIVPAGNPTFNQVILTSGTNNGYYINQVAACATGTCAITGSGAVGATPCTSWVSP